MLSNEVIQAVAVGTKDCSSESQSASRAARRLQRLQLFSAAKEETKKRKFEEFHSSLLSSQQKRSGETVLISELSLSRYRDQATTLSTHGCGVQVERAPHLGFSLKAMRSFGQGSFITQYEGKIETIYSNTKSQKQNIKHTCLLL
jgi:hypothetical protein